MRDDISRGIESFVEGLSIERNNKYQLEIEIIHSVLDKYLEGEITPAAARKEIAELSMTEVLQNTFKNLLSEENHLKPKEQLIYGFKYASVYECKNTCEMKSVTFYEKEPSWNVRTTQIYKSATIVLTNEGVHFMCYSDYFIPYKKIVNIGFKEGKKKDRLYFDIKTTSPYGRRIYFENESIVEEDEDLLFRVTQLIGIMAKLYD